MKKLRLYTVSWSLHCIKAEELLKNAEIDFEKMDFTENPEKLNALARDLNLCCLPALEVVEDNKVELYEGLKNIELYTRTKK